MSRSHQSLEVFRHEVVLKYQLYNSLFLTLPFSDLATYGSQLPLFAKEGKEKLEKGISPQEIVDDFLRVYHSLGSEREHFAVLFLFLQLVEREVVLFDALEDAAYERVHDLRGSGTLETFLHRVHNQGNPEEKFLAIEKKKIRVVLTAHPTQFYPVPVLNIIDDLANALKKGSLEDIESLLYQMGYTSFQYHEAPTPLDEAQLLIERLGEVFYPVIRDIHFRLYEDSLLPFCPIELGFWPGGDRDGNPNVNATTTLTVAKKLRERVLVCYLQEVKLLERRLSFPQVQNTIKAIYEKLENTINNTFPLYTSSEGIVQDLEGIRELLQTQFHGLFSDQVTRLILAIHSFGFHFASLDIRQDSKMHEICFTQIFGEEYAALQMQEKCTLLTQALKDKPRAPSLVDPISKDILESLQALKTIQGYNGERGAHRYIISNTGCSSQVLEIFLLAYWAFKSLESVTLDIVPLFETIGDLAGATRTLEELFLCPLYRAHLARREDIQHIMLGFSDGSKDGGYTTSNLAIFKCKQEANICAQKHGVHIVFFDGRGGPPARGGGNTHNFYRAMAYQLPCDEVQLTIQGQTISSTFGTYQSARYNLEQLFTATIQPILNPDGEDLYTEKQWQLLHKISDRSHRHYLDLKHDPQFVSYLYEMTPLRYTQDLKHASRPMRRQTQNKKSLKDLRAIPFVGAWSQMKQNIPGFYGLGTALETLCHDGQEHELKQLYKQCSFFRTLVDNAMQVLCKTYQPLTQFLLTDPVYGSFCQKIHSEAGRSKESICRISGQKELLAHDPINRTSIRCREDLILPLLIIQQCALAKLRENNLTPEEKDSYEKLLLKSIPANINASRNSA